MCIHRVWADEWVLVGQLQHQECKSASPHSGRETGQPAASFGCARRGETPPLPPRLPVPEQLHLSREGGVEVLAHLPRHLPESVGWLTSAVGGGAGVGGAPPRPDVARLVECAQFCSHPRGGQPCAEAVEGTPPGQRTFSEQGNLMPCPHDRLPTRPPGSVLFGMAYNESLSSALSDHRYTSEPAWPTISIGDGDSEPLGHKPGGVYL